MRRFRLRRVMQLGVLVALAACGGDDSDRKNVSNDRCTIEMDECDVEETSCLESLLALTVCAREGGGHTPALPPIQRITTAEFAESLRTENEEQGATTKPWDLVLPELSLTPKGESSNDAAVDVLADSVLAFYDDEKRDITIITDTKVHDPQDKMFVVMHELTHYLQGVDNSFSDLRTQAGASTDNRAALAALIEGEATVTSTRALIWLLNRAPETLDWGPYFDSLDESIFQSIEDSAAPLIAALQGLPYSVGGRFIEALWEDGDRSDVDALFKTWPHTLRQWLNEPGYDEEDDLKETLACAPPLPPDGFQVFEVESFGVVSAFAGDR